VTGIFVDSILHCKDIQWNILIRCVQAVLLKIEVDWAVTPY